MKYMGTLLAVRDMEKSKRFYCELLGLKVVGDFGANISLSGGLFLQTAVTWKEFIRRDEIVFRNDASELYFETDDMDDFIKKLEDFGSVDYVHPAVEQPWGQRAVRFYDPDGHIVEVGEKLKIVMQRFVNSGLSVAETAMRMGVPEEYVRAELDS